jgi:hypothetical protein
MCRTSYFFATASIALCSTSQRCGEQACHRRLLIVCDHLVLPVTPTMKAWFILDHHGPIAYARTVRATHDVILVLLLRLSDAVCICRVQTMRQPPMELRRSYNPPMSRMMDLMSTEKRLGRCSRSLATSVASLSLVRSISRRHTISSVDLSNHSPFEPYVLRFSGSSRSSNGSRPCASRHTFNTSA